MRSMYHKLRDNNPGSAKIPNCRDTADFKIDYKKSKDGSLSIMRLKRCPNKISADLEELVVEEAKKLTIDIDY